MIWTVLCSTRWRIGRQHQLRPGRQALSPRSLEDIRTFVGNGVGRLIHLAVPHGTPPEAEAKCLSDFRAHYLLNMENKTAPYPGILALLDRLRAAGFRLAVVSNKFDGAVKGLCAAYFGARIPVAIGESPTVARKPAPNAVLRALEELGSTVGQAVYVGELQCGSAHCAKRRAALHLGGMGIPKPGISSSGPARSAWRIRRRSWLRCWGWPDSSRPGSP